MLINLRSPFQSAICLVLLLCNSFASYASTSDNEGKHLVVAEPFIELHTGAGRGYPVHHSAERGQKLKLLKRRANWYLVETEEKKTGWAKASSLAYTLQDTGLPADLPSVSHGDYLQSSFRVGFTTGQLKGASAFSFLLGYRPFKFVGFEAEYGNIFESSVTGRYYGANVLIEPVQKWNTTPFISLGKGVMTFDQRQKLAGGITSDADYTSYGAGLNYYMGRNFQIRGEYKWYALSADGQSNDLSEWRLGFSSFF